MSYEVRMARRAMDYVRRLDRRAQDRVMRRLEQVPTDPFGPFTKPLTGAGGRRSARVGDWRIVFSVDTGAEIVSVSAIGPRGRVYRDL